MATLSSIAIRINKENDVTVNFNDKTMPFSDFIQTYFENLEPVKETVIGNKTYLDFVMYDVSWNSAINKEINMVIETIEKIDKEGGEAGLIEIIEVCEHDEVFTIGQPFDIGLNYVRTTKFTF